METIDHQVDIRIQLVGEIEGLVYRLAELGPGIELLELERLIYKLRIRRLVEPPPAHTN